MHRAHNKRVAAFAPSRPGVVYTRRRRRRLFLILGLTALVMLLASGTGFYLSGWFRQRQRQQQRGETNWGKDTLDDRGNADGKAAAPKSTAANVPSTQTPTTASASTSTSSSTARPVSSTTTGTPAVFVVGDGEARTDAPTASAGEVSASPRPAVPMPPVVGAEDTEERKGGAGGGGRDTINEAIATNTTATVTPTSAVVERSALVLRLYPHLARITDWDDFAHDNDNGGDDGRGASNKQRNGKDAGAEAGEETENENDGLLCPVAGGDASPANGEQGDAAADGLTFAAGDAVAPLRKVRVELYRQRINRHTWWSPGAAAAATTGRGDDDDQAHVVHGTVTATATTSRGDASYASPIVCLRGPSLPVTHYYPRELLVEETLAGDDGPNRAPDPLRMMPMHARDGTGTGGVAKRGHQRSCEIDVMTSYGDGDGAAGMAPTAATTARVLSVASRKKQPLAAAGAGAPPFSSSPYASLRWLWFEEGRAASTAAAPVDLDLYTIRPGAAGAGGNGNGNGNENQNEDEEDPNASRTSSLAAAFTFRGLRSLYGLPGHRGRAPPPQPPTPPQQPQPFMPGLMIPLDGFEYLASATGHGPFDDAAAVPGVIPLFFAELGSGSQDGGGGGAVRTDEETERVAVVGILWLSSAPFSVRTSTTLAATAPTRATTRLTIVGSAAEARVFLLPGPTHADVLRQYHTLTGFPTLPPLFSLGYHHHFQTYFQNGRNRPGLGNMGNANDSTLPASLEGVNALFLASGIPLDSIGYTAAMATQRMTSFTWKLSVLPDPGKLQSELWLQGRRFYFARAAPFVPVVQSSPVLHEGVRHRFLTTAATDGDAWAVAFPREAVAPLIALRQKQQHGDGRGSQRGGGGGGGGESLPRYRTHIVDLFNPSARRWLRGMLKYRRFLHSTNHTFVSLTAAAPGVILSPGNTLPMAVGHRGGVSHRQVHNAHASYFLMAVFHGLMRRSRYHRRAFAPVDGYFVGVHRFGGAVSLVQSTVYAAPFIEHDRNSSNGDDNAENTTAVEGGETATTTTTTTAARQTAQRQQWQWDRLRAAVEDVVALSMSGVPMAGTNIALGFDEADDINAHDNTVSDGGGSAALHRAELVARWYQAASLFPFMRAEEGRGGLPSSVPTARTRRASTITNANGIGNGTGGVTAINTPPSLVYAAALSARTLPALLASPAAQEAVRVRYALLPYLYGGLRAASEAGAPVLALLASPSSTTTTATASSSGLCVGFGSALVACPVTSPTAATASTAATVTLPLGSPSDPPRQLLYDFYTGQPHSPGQAVSVAAAEGRAGGGAYEGCALLWLGQQPKTALNTPPDEEKEVKTNRNGPVVSRLPLFQRSGTIVPTFTTFAHGGISNNINGNGNGQQQQQDGSSSPPLSSYWGTRTPSNVSLSIALPAGLAEVWAASVADPTRRYLLAAGELYWDEGSVNFQVSPPPSSLEQDEATTSTTTTDASQQPRRRRVVGGSGGDTPDDGDGFAAVESRRAAARAEGRRLAALQSAEEARLRAAAAHCHLRLRCHVEAGRMSVTGTLIAPSGGGVESPISTPTATGTWSPSARCVAALEAAERGWNELPELAVAEFIAGGNLAEAGRHAEERAADKAADHGGNKGLPRPRPSNNNAVGDGRPLAYAYNEFGRLEISRVRPRDVLTAATLVDHTIETVLRLRHVRFLTVSPADAQHIAAVLSSPSPSVSGGGTVSLMPILPRRRDPPAQPGQQEEEDEEEGTVVTMTLPAHVSAFGLERAAVVIPTGGGGATDAANQGWQSGWTVKGWDFTFGAPPS